MKDEEVPVLLTKAEAQSRRLHAYAMESPPSHGQMLTEVADLLVQMSRLMKAGIGQNSQGKAAIDTLTVVLEALRPESEQSEPVDGSGPVFGAQEALKRTLELLATEKRMLAIEKIPEIPGDKTLSRLISYLEDARASAKEWNIQGRPLGLVVEDMYREIERLERRLALQKELYDEVCERLARIEYARDGVL